MELFDRLAGLPMTAEFVSAKLLASMDLVVANLGNYPDNMIATHLANLSKTSVRILMKDGHLGHGNAWALGL